MGRLRVVETPNTKTLWKLEIYDGKTCIGEYERSVKHQISRKKREVASAENFLLDVYRKHGFFQVRWDGVAREKSVRVNDNEIATIPGVYWK